MTTTITAQERHDLAAIYALGRAAMQERANSEEDRATAAKQRDLLDAAHATWCKLLPILSDLEPRATVTQALAAMAAKGDAEAAARGQVQGELGEYTAADLKAVGHVHGRPVRYELSAPDGTDIALTYQGTDRWSVATWRGPYCRHVTTNRHPTWQGAQALALMIANGIRLDPDYERTRRTNHNTAY